MAASRSIATLKNQTRSVDDISPGFSADYAKYIEISPGFNCNPEARQHMHPQAENDVYDVFFSDSKREHHRTNEAADRRIRMLHTRIRSKLQQTEAIKFLQLRGPSTSKDFQKSPRTFGRTVEEVAVHTAERVYLTREEGNRAQFISKLLLDPGLINDNRLRNLGLEEFIAPKGSNMEERMLLNAQAIEELRKMLLAIEPIRRPDEREDDELRYFRLMRSPQGYVLGTQYVYTGKKGEKVKKKTLFKTDLYNAGLRLKEIDASYENEIGILKMIQELLNSIIADLERWKQLEPAERDKISETIGEIVAQLENVDDEDKIELRILLEKAITLKDKHGRYNPQAKVSQVERARDYLGSRFKTIEETWAHLGKDKAKVEQIRQKNIQPLSDFMREVFKLHEEFSILHPTTPMTPAKKNKIIANLNSRRAEAEKMNFEPLLSFAQVFVTHIDASIAALESGDQATASQEFMKMFVVTKVARSMDRLKLVYERMALTPETIHPADVETEIKNQYEKLKAKEVGTDIATKEYNKMFGELYRLYRGLLKSLRTLERPGFTSKPESDEEPLATPPPVTLESKPKTTVASIIDSLKTAVPNLSIFFGRIQDRVARFITSKKATAEVRQPQAQAGVSPVEEVEPAKPTQYQFTMEQKLAAYAEMQKRINSLDYPSLVHRHIPQTPKTATT